MASAEAIVDAIIDDLSGRKGLGDEWDQIDDEIRAEIRARWIALASVAEDKSGMSAEERRAFREEGVVPVGWRWCPDCNGEGRISTMDANPDLTEHEFDCERCVAEQGIVPDA